MKFLTKDSVVERFRASGFHLLISVFIAVLVTIPVVVWLYPRPYFEAAGGANLFLLIIGVDVLLGPFLTFCVFNSKKTSLFFDLTIVVCLQLAALVYGMYATVMSRPVFMTFVVDRFEMVSYADVDPEEFKKAPKDLKLPSWGEPVIAYAHMPDDPALRSDVLFSALNGVDLVKMFRYYQSVENALPLLVQRSKPLSELGRYNQTESITRALNGLDKQKLKFVPMMGRKRDLTVLVDAKSGKLIKVVDLQPWPLQ